MLIETRLRKLETHHAVAIDQQKRDHIRAQVRLMLQASVRDPEAWNALDEIADAHFEFGPNDLRTREIIARHTPVIAAAIERHRAMQAG